MQRNDYVTARDTAKELHLLLKGEEIVQLPIDTITEIKKLLNSFYNRHQELWDLNKKFYGIGRQLEDLSERVK